MIKAYTDSNGKIHAEHPGRNPGETLLVDYDPENSANTCTAIRGFAASEFQVAAFPNKFFYDMTYDIKNERKYTVDELKPIMIERLKQQAREALAPTDWYVVRRADVGEDIPDDVHAGRALIRNRCNEIEASILSASTMEELKAIGI